MEEGYDHERTRQPGLTTGYKRFPLPSPLPSPVIITSSILNSLFFSSFLLSSNKISINDYISTHVKRLLSLEALKIGTSWLKTFRAVEEGEEEQQLLEISWKEKILLSASEKSNAVKKLISTIIYIWFLERIYLLTIIYQCLFFHQMLRK